MNISGRRDFRFVTSVLILAGVMFSAVGALRADNLPVTAGLLLRLEADAGVTTINGRVSAWEDQALALGGANDATNTGGTGPVLVANGINGLPTLNFDGSNEFLQVAGNVAFDIDTFTWIIVTQYTRNTASTQTLLNSAYSTGAGTSSGELWGTKTGKGDPFAYARNISGSSDSSGGLGLDTPVILSAVWAGDDTLTQWISGKKNTTRTGLDAAPSGHVSTQIGKPANVSSSFFNGNISEVLIYDRALSGAERQQVEVFLGDKYGISIVPEPNIGALLSLGGIFLLLRRYKWRGVNATDISARSRQR